MKELFDVHCHMVPGVDDGAADLEESLAMLKMQHEDGVRKIIITPHYRRRLPECRSRRAEQQGGGCLKHRQKRYMSSF